MPIRFLNTVDLTVTSSILKTDANGVIVAAVAGTDYINTVTSAMVTTALGYTPVPTTRTLTINGTALDLSADRSWTITTITGNAGSATVLQTARTLTIGNTGKTFNGSANVSWTLAEIGAYAATNPSGYITSSGNISGYAGSLEREDNRTISPSELTAGRLKFGFTSWSNNNTAPYADFLHLRSYTDASGGNDNLVMFRKDAIGMRVWQQAWGSTTAYSSFKDVAFTDSSITGNAGSATVLQTARTINGTSFNGSADITTANWGTARTITIGNTGKSVNGSANVSWTLAEIGAQAALTNPVTGTGTTNYLPKFTGATTIGNSQVFDNGTNVGIGTTSPAQKVQIGDGTATGSQYFRIFNSASDIYVGQSGGTIFGFSANSAGFVLSDNTSFPFGIGTTSAQPFVIGTTNAERMRITAAGNVGIGTTAPAQKFEVYGDEGQPATSGTTQNGMVRFRPGSTEGWGEALDFGMHIGVSGPASYAWLQATNAGNLGLSYNLAINPNGGSVGVGTASPTNRLHVTSSAVFGAVSRALKIEQTLGGGDTTQPSYYGSILLSGGGYNWGAIDTIQTNPSASWTSRIAFSTMPGGGDYNLYERMCITNGGNVGIGTTNFTDVSFGAPALKVFGSRATLGLTSSGTLATIAMVPSNDPTKAIHLNQGSDGSFRWYQYSVGSETFSLAANGNVGIGTTAPAYKLDVVGGDFRIMNVSGPTLNFSDNVDQNWDIGVDATTNDFYFKNGISGVRHLTIDDGGNVGIGTTNPIYKLHVNTSGSSENVIGVTNGTQTLTLGVNNSSGGSFLFENSASALRFGTSGTERMRITSAGNVGIGTTSPGLTTSGRTVLSINGSISSLIEFKTGDAFRGYIFRGDSFMEFYDNNALYFSTNGAVRSVITSAGNVGIGTTSPTNQLTVTTATNAVDVVRLNNTGGDSGSVQGVTHLAINHFNSGTNPSTRITAYQDGVSGWPGGMYFSTRSLNTDSAPVERMRITSAGNVGIGTSSPNASYRTTITTGAGQTGALQTTGSVNINSGALAVGSITPSGTAGRIDASNDIVAFSTSDRRFKENITPIANALDKVKTLTGVEFDWKQETKDYHGYVGHDVGVIAQDVQAVLPEAVRTNANGYLSVRYEKMIALLVEAMKEQQNQIDELKAQLRGNS